MKIANNLTELIGKTPLVKINSCNTAKILAKLESFNPAGSAKDRIALNMIDSAEKQGLISPKTTTIIEPTSGNTGIGLALVCAVKGYKLILTMPETMSIERQKLVKAYGAKVVLTSAEKGMLGAIEKADELAEKLKDAYIPQQFCNIENPKIHEKTTAEEIWTDTDGTVDVIVAGVGTGGTLSGIAKSLKKKNPDIKIIAVEPANSAVLSGKPAGLHKIQGIGAGFIPENCDKTLFDEIVTVSNESAIQTARKIGKEEGLLVGFSGGAAFHAAFKIAEKTEYKNKTIVVIIPDSGERYLSTDLFN